MYLFMLFAIANSWHTLRIAILLAATYKAESNWDWSVLLYFTMEYVWFCCFTWMLCFKQSLPSIPCVSCSKCFMNKTITVLSVKCLKSKNLPKTFQMSNAPVVFAKTQIPSSLHRFFNQDDDNIIINGLQCDHPDEVVREAAYRLHYYFNPQTERLLSRC